MIKLKFQFCQMHSINCRMSKVPWCDDVNYDDVIDCKRSWHKMALMKNINKHMKCDTVKSGMKDV